RKEQREKVNRRRSSGVLLHPTSLPSQYGVGDLGPQAEAFLDLMESGHQSLWQILPLTPVTEDGSPYWSRSLFAGNILLLSPEIMAEEGYLSEVPSSPVGGKESAVDYGSALSFKEAVVDNAYRRSYEKARNEPEFEEFMSLNSHWLDDFALFDAI